MTTVKYDVAAAAELEAALAAVRGAVTTLLDTRASLTRSQLGDPAARPYWLWAGRLRDDFDRESAQHQSTLGGLLDTLQTALRQVQQATAQATADATGQVPPTGGGQW
jgi:hypothetical protein